MKKDEIIQALKRGNQRVEQSLIANQSMLVYDLQQQNFEDFEYNTKITFDNIYDYNYQDQAMKFLQENHQNDCQKITQIEGQRLSEELYNNFEDEIKEFLQCQTDIMYEMQEYYEAWLVDSWLFDELEKRGHLIIDYKGLEQWWGRGCTGQRVMMDYDIQDIVINLAGYYLGLETSKIQEFLDREKILSFNL